jgi:hypothetical protein
MYSGDAVSLDLGSDEVDQSADDRNVLDHVDDLIRAGNGIADESCVDRDGRKDEEHDQRDGNIATSRRKIDPLNRTPLSAAGGAFLHDRSVSEA